MSVRTANVSSVLGKLEKPRASARWAIPLAALAGAAISLASTPARAQLTIKDPNDHPPYRVELDVHGDIAPWHLGYHDYYRDCVGCRYNTFGSPEFGAGFYATIKIVDPGFIPKLNNTVGILFGFDATNCYRCYRDGFRLYLPVAALNWNFWLTRKWSVFADPGFMLFTQGFYRYIYPDFFFEIGGRYHFNDTVALNMKVGYPFIPQVGVSFFLGK